MNLLLFGIIGSKKDEWMDEWMKNWLERQTNGLMM